MFVGAALEGDLTVLLAGIVAHMGMFSLTTAVVVAWVGGVAGDLLWYLVGRIGAEVIQGRAVYTRVAPMIERVAARIGAWEIAVARFLYGAHTASMLFWGLHRFSVVRFLGLSAVGCALWAGSFVGLGYALSNSAAALIGEVKRAEAWLLGGVLAAAAIVFALRAVMRGRIERSTRDCVSGRGNRPQD